MKLKNDNESLPMEWLRNIFKTEEIVEIDVDGVTYYTNDKDHKNGDIYEVLDNGEPGYIVGEVVNGNIKFFIYDNSHVSINWFIVFMLTTVITYIVVTIFGIDNIFP